MCVFVYYHYDLFNFRYMICITNGETDKMVGEG